MFEVILTNFGTNVLESDFRIEALYKAEMCGYESTILKNGEYYASYSPISGWRFN